MFIKKEVLDDRYKHGRIKLKSKTCGKCGTTDDRFGYFVCKEFCGTEALCGTCYLKEQGKTPEDCSEGLKDFVPSKETIHQWNQYGPLDLCKMIEEDFLAVATTRDETP